MPGGCWGCHGGVGDGAGLLGIWRRCCEGVGDEEGMLEMRGMVQKVESVECNENGEG